MRKVVVGVGVFVATLVSGMPAALAHNCYNASRPGGSLSTDPADFSAPVSKGLWVWLPSVGVPLPAWGFGVPDNFMSGDAHWFLANTPYCEEGGVLFYGGPRTTQHGAQSGCGAF